MKRILNKLTGIIIVIYLITLFTITGCKEQAKVEVMPAGKVTPVFVSHPTELPATLAKTPPILKKIPSVTPKIPKLIKTSQEKETYVFVKKFGSEGSGDGQFKGFSGADRIVMDGKDDIAIDKEGYLYVLDFGNHRIQKFNLNGKFIVKWDIKEPSDRKIKGLLGISIDLDNNIYVVENKHTLEFTKSNAAEDINTIQKFTCNANFITKWVIKEHPTRIRVSQDKKIYALCYQSIYKYDSEGNVITNWNIQPKSSPDVNPATITISDIAIDAENNIVALGQLRLLVDFEDFSRSPTIITNENFIMKFTSDGHLIKQYDLYDEKKRKIT